MSTGFGKVAIVGVGLLGASLGLALKQRGLASKVVGIGRRQSALDTARDRNAIEEGTLDLGTGVRGADLIVLCSPVSTIIEQLDIVRTRIAPHVVVTDVGSTKADICARVRENWSRPLRFVGSHPMAGSEKFGPEHASANLYEGCVTIVEPLDEHAEDAHRTVCGLWKSVGARVVEISPRAHDDIVARTSHIPHILAAMVAELAATNGNVRDFIGKGFQDVTRVAAGRAELWRDICLTNRDAIVDGLGELGARVEQIRDLIAQGNGEALEAFFQSAQNARKTALGEDAST